MSNKVLEHLYTTDFYFEVAKGNVLHHAARRISAYLPALTVNYQTVWSFGGLFPWLDGFLSFDLVSDDINDTLAGTGAQKVFVTGETATGLESEIVEMDGLTPVSLVNDYRLPVDIKVIQAGASGSAAGNISLDTGGTTYGYIAQGDNANKAATYSVPEGKTAFITRADSTTVANNAQGRIIIRRGLEPWILDKPFELSANIVDAPFQLPIRLLSGTLIEVQAKGSPNKPLTFGLNIILVDNDA